MELSRTIVYKKDRARTLVRKVGDQMSQNQVSTLKRGLLVLEFIKQSRGLTLAEVMKEFQLSNSTAKGYTRRWLCV